MNIKKYSIYVTGNVYNKAVHEKAIYEIFEADPNPSPKIASVLLLLLLSPDTSFILSRENHLALKMLFKY